MKKRLFLLGAGASHGAGFESYKKIKPPLIKDFFRIFKEFNYFGNDEKRINTLFDFLSDEFQWAKSDLGNGYPDIEQVLDKIDERKKDLTEDKNLVRCLENRSLLTDLMVESLHRTTWMNIKKIFLGMPACPYHEAIAESLNPSQDMIISLNYDLIMDAALIKSKKWNYKTGYGLFFESYFLNNKWYDMANVEEDIFYFKLHGSVNWFISTGHIGTMSTAAPDSITYDGLEKDKLFLSDPESYYKYNRIRLRSFGPVRNQNRRPFIQHLIVGPGKKQALGPLGILWEKSRQKLKKINEVVWIGCSLRENDSLLIELLKTIPWQSLQRFILVEPSDVIIERIEKVFGRETDCKLKDISDLPAEIFKES